MQQPRKRITLTTDARPLPPQRKQARPVGMQEMGPGMYEQIRKALVELAPASNRCP